MVLLMTLMAVGVFFVWLWRRPQHPVDQLPGPKKLPFFGNILHFVGSRDVAFERFNALARQYQPLYRTWLASVPVVHLMAPKYMEIILRSSQHISKSRDYDLLKDWLGTGLLTSGGSKWHSRRKLLTPAFHFSILEQFIPVFSDKSHILVTKLQENVDKKDGIDITPFITRCTLDVVCETAMGTELNAQEDLDSEYVAAIYTINELVVHRLLRPWLYPDWIYSLTPAGRQHKRTIKILHDFTNKVIRERRIELSSKKVIIQADENQNSDQIIGVKKRVAFLDLLLQMSEQDSEFNDEQIRQEVDTFMFEGHDTTAMAISWALHYLSCNEEIQERCYKELQEIFNDDSESTLTLSDLNNMRYLERVIKETLRLRPSVFLINRKVDAGNMLNIDEHEFPEGTKVQVHIFNIHRNPDIYPEPEKFDPDRFLPENCTGRHPYAYIPFSAGPRNCIGQKFAMLEMKSTLSSVIRHFKLSAKNAEESSQYLPDLLLRPKNGIILGLSPRDKSTF